MSRANDAPQGIAEPPRSEGSLYLERLAREAIERTRQRSVPTPTSDEDIKFILSTAGALAGEEFEGSETQ